MKTEATKRVSRSRVPVLHEDDDAGIFNVAAPDSIAHVSRASLLPEEEQISLPASDARANNALAPLTRFLGPQLTVANPAWSSDPIPQMRALQKKLVEHSLTLGADDRTECMDAIRVVENAVQLRLRFQQMRMADGEHDLKPREEIAS